MSEENVEIVRSVLEPLDGINGAEVDWSAEAIREMLGRAYSQDIELTTLDIPLALDIRHNYRGLDGLVNYLRAWLEPFSEYHVENLDYIEAGDCVLVPSRQWGVGHESGTRTELELTTLFELRGGKIVRIHQFDTLGEALEAAGLSE
jgi:ketosteroid isomerase-like protein